MYHCDACGWDVAEPVLSDEPSISTDLLWTIRVCPECGEEVYETRVVRHADMRQSALGNSTAADV